MQHSTYPLGLFAQGALVLPRGHGFVAAQVDPRHCRGALVYAYIGSQHSGAYVETVGTTGQVNAPSNANVLTVAPGQLIPIPRGEQLRLLIKPHGPTGFDADANEAVVVVCYEPGELAPDLSRPPAGGEVLYQYQATDVLARGVDTVLIDGDVFPEANGLALHLEAELRGGATSLGSAQLSTDYPCELLLLQGTEQAFARCWLYPGDGTLTLRANIMQHRRTRPDGDSARWRLVARYPAGAQRTTSTVSSAIALVSGHVGEVTGYQLARYYPALTQAGNGFASWCWTTQPSVAGTTRMGLVVRNLATVGVVSLNAGAYVPSIWGGPYRYGHVGGNTAASGVSVTNIATGHCGVAVLNYGTQPTGGACAVWADFGNGR